MRRGTILLLFSLVMTLSGAAQEQRHPDPETSVTQEQRYPGLQAAAREKFDLWARESNRLDTEFRTKLKQALADPPTAKSDFCAQNYKDQIDRVLTLLDDQASAYKRLYFYSEQDFKKDEESHKQILRTQDELAEQYKQALARARGELQHLGEQKSDLEEQLRNGAFSDRTQLNDPPTSGPGPAPEQQVNTHFQEALEALNRAMATAKVKVDKLAAIGDLTKQTKASLIALLKTASTNQIEMQQSSSLVDVESLYWKSYYAMRRTQVIEVCRYLPPPPPPYLKAPETN